MTKGLRLGNAGPHCFKLPQSDHLVITNWLGRPCIGLTERETRSPDLATKLDGLSPLGRRREPACRFSKPLPSATRAPLLVPDPTTFPGETQAPAAGWP